MFEVKVLECNNNIMFRSLWFSGWEKDKGGGKRKGDILIKKNDIIIFF